MRTRSFVPWALVLTTSLGGAGVGPALAQTLGEPGWPPPEGAACKPSKGDDDEAQTLFKLAAKAEDTSNYADAIKYYKDAYKRACNKHLLLKNLGRAYEKDAQYAAAVEAYKLYRARGKPTGEDLDLIDQKIANLSKKVPGAEPSAAASGTSATAGTAAPPPTAGGTANATPAATVTAAPTTAPAASGGSIVPWVVVGAGGAVFVVGGLVGLGANGTVQSKQTQFDDLGCSTVAGAARNGAQCLSLKKEGENASKTRTIGWVMAGVGGAAVLGGLAWWYFGSKATKKTALQLTPGPTVAGLGLAGSF
jgi:hypothetical protein